MFLILTILQRWKKFMSFFLVSEFFPTSQNTFRNKFEAFVSKQVKPRIWSWTKATLPATDGFKQISLKQSSYLLQPCVATMRDAGGVTASLPFSQKHNSWSGWIHNLLFTEKHPESEHLVSGLPSRSLLRVFKTATTFYLWNRSN